MVKIKIRCIHCESEEIVKMGYQRTELLDACAKTAVRPSKHITLTMDQSLKSKG